MIKDAPEVGAIRDETESALSTVTCGCGFSASGHDEGQLRWMIEDHMCGNQSWLSPVFSWQGVQIVLVICIALSEIFGGGS